ncbi:hypothetical protein CLV84_0999 [Neolewinella xylanilytica]|uniref:Uncharacterized protein n=1 Tax=Neolewinella xylanilytica TaxID=1514080 RepID=A0A2S6I958_9BACT|nr:hypothetical protein CLV84_0999 [Neolewinella xylanilytica]
MLFFIIVFVFVHSVNLIWPGFARALFISGHYQRFG